jgi:hypothetical protein
MDTAAQDVRNMLARDSRMLDLANAHDRFAELEQMHWLLGNTAEAAGAKRYAEICLNAYVKEMRDPKPKGLATLPPYRYDARDRG